MLRRIFALLLMAGPAAGGPVDPVTDSDYLPVNRAEAELGQLLFYDPLLSGNRNISCATCHHPRFGTSDGLSLGIGEGGIGIGPQRVLDPANLPEQRIPRNAPALWNLGAQEFTVLFLDGRIEADPSQVGGIRTPLDADMTQGFSGVLAAQTMFPVLSQHEMAGQYGENEISKLVRQGLITGEGGAWQAIAARVAALPEYQAAFAAAYPEIAAGRQIAFTDIANAVAAFMAFEWRSDDSAFDAHLRGQVPLQGAALRGMELFYGAAGCSACHASAFQTDHGFHAMGVPQIGPGKKASFEHTFSDEGRMRVTGKPEDAFRFRTPSLRNVMLTSPYGHDGAYRDLRAFLEAHVGGAPPADYDRAQAVLPALPGATDWDSLDDPADTAAVAAAFEGPSAGLGQGDLDDLMAFLDALTGATARMGRLGIPNSVPSGLEVDR